MKTAVITGGTGAIGSALVREFARDYSVVFTYSKNSAAAEKLSTETGAVGLKVDLTDSSTYGALAPYTDTCALLVNNAGIARIKLLGDTTDAELDEMIATDLTGTIRLTRELSRGMVRAHCGCIVNISSMWGVCGASCEVPYSAAKAGIIGFTKALAKELGPSGIRVNCIAPGVIESPMNAHLTDDELRELIDATPLMKLGKPEDVSHAARFFEENAFTTGQVLTVDGGFSV